jgi:Baseplate J-like protein
MAARTADQILAAYTMAVTQVNPGADGSKGPLYDLVGQPMAQVLATTEADVQTLTQIYSVQFAQVATPAQAQAFLTNWGVTAGPGNNATVLEYFMKFSAPTINQNIPVPVGSVVANSDQSLQFITVESGVIQGNLAASYFNATRGTYEIALNCVAVAPGTQYNLPSGLVNSIVSSIPGIDAVENRTDIDNGLGAETIPQQITRTQNSFMGTNLNSYTGNANRVQAYNPTLITAVNVVPSSNRLLFKRIAYQPAADYYVIGISSLTVNQTYTSISGGEVLIPLEYVPALSINSVTLNGTTINNFVLVSDTSLATGGSAIADDQMLLASPLLPGDVLIINTSYNSLLSGIQTNVFGQTELFNTNELARSFFKVPVVISMTGQALPSQDPNVVTANVLAELQTLIEPGIWQSEILPDQVLTQLQVNVPGLSNPVLQQFHRLTYATSSIETAVFALNELAEYDTNYISVTISGTN